VESLGVITLTFGEESESCRNVESHEFNNNNLIVIFVKQMPSVPASWCEEDYKWILGWLRAGNTTPRYCSKSVLEKILTMLDPEKDNELLVSIHKEIYDNIDK